jgi:predicted MFS family arabinose efflux permease
MIFFSGNLRLSMGMAVVPAVISVAILIFAVREPKYQHKEHGRSLFRHIDFYLFPAVYWKVVAIGALLSLARFSEAFLILRAQSIGLPYTFLPLVLILMNLVYAIVAYPSGRLSDKISRDTVIIISTGFLLTSQILLGGAVGFLSLFLGIGFWGLHLGFSQGVIAAFVMDTSSPRLRGTAFGLFSFIFGVTQLAASILAGILWDRYGASATFFTGAGFSLLALLGLLAMRAQKNKSEKGG